MPFTAKVITTDEWNAKPPVLGESPFAPTKPNYSNCHEC